MVDDKIYVITNKHKNVSKQIEKNNNVCIVAYDDEKWIRISCIFQVKNGPRAN